MSETVMTIVSLATLALGAAIIGVIALRASRAGGPEPRTAEPLRESPVRRFLIRLPLALALLNTAGIAAMLRPGGLFEIVIVLAIMAVLAGALHLVLKAVNAAMPLPDFIGFATGAIAASHAVVWWLTLSAPREPPDPMVILAILHVPITALLAAILGAPLGWLIGAAYRRLACGDDPATEAP